MAKDAARKTPSVEPDASPWPVPPVEGLPFGKDSDEARAIERVLEQAEEDRRTTSSHED